MTAAETAVAIARDWLGTPYRHQGTCCGAGCDCLGLLRGIWRELYGAEPEPVPPYSPDWAEPQGGEPLLEAAQRWLVARPHREAAIGDVLVFRIRSDAPAKHLGIQSALAPSPRFIHAYERHGVTESPLSAPWARRIAARFAFPEEVF